MLKQKWKKQFKPEFFKRCCKLICDFKPVVNPFLNKHNEDQITHIYEQNIDSFLRGKGRNLNIVVYKGGAFPQPKDKTREGNTDLVFKTALGLKLETIFECKILGINSKYINEGIQRFVIEKYGFKNMPFYGMLGYVKDDDSATGRHTKLQQSINKKKRKLNLINQKIVENSDTQVIFKTKHKIINAKCNSHIEITHILHCWEMPSSVV